MNETDYLIGIYNYINLNPEDHELGARYYILYLLDQKGLLDQEESRKFYLEKFKENEIPKEYIGPFENVEKLNQFAFQLCEHLNAQKVSLLSVQDYNSLLESSISSTEFHRDLLEKGNVMENIEHKKKGFFNRLFS